MLQIFEISTLKDMLLTSIFWPGEFHGLHSPWDCKESDTTDGITKAKVIQGRIVKDSERVCKSESMCIYLFFFNTKVQDFLLTSLASSTFSKYTKANPLERLDCWSYTIDTSAIGPYLENTSLRSLSVVYKLNPNTPRQQLGSGFA